MNDSIIFFDANSNLINPKDDDFLNKKLVEIVLDYTKPIDEQLTEIIIFNLVDVDYTNIIIPVCFGEILSDFLGLRLASHIRCTPGINQNKNIFLYSFTGIKDYFSNECFNIVKTKGVFLIDYDIETILNSSQENKIYLSNNPLINEVKKLNLHVPLNYEDSHSLANEWAIYRWAQSINAYDKNIEKIQSKLHNDLYFKYLKTINPIVSADTLKNEDLKINYEGKVNVLYIDDEANKGWYEIFCNILTEKNQIDFNYLDDFNEKTTDEIIDISLEKIKDYDVDLVILDLRLHKDDFNSASIESITGFQILKKIKEFNEGIQVVIFSATNKIWNLQALQLAGADGFIIKEAPENSVDPNFTKQSIESYISTIKFCLKKTFLKEIFKELKPLEKLIKNELIKKIQRYSLSINKPLLEKIDNQLIVSKKLLIDSPFELKWSFINLVLIIEQIINESYVDNGYTQEVSTENFLSENCNYIKQGARMLAITPVNNGNRFVKGEYEVTDDEMSFYNQRATRVPFNFRLTCLLHFKYKLPLDYNIFKYFQIYQLRSDSVAHAGNKDVVLKDYRLVLDLLKILIK